MAQVSVSELQGFLRELGYPELEATNWSGLVVPKGTPPAVIVRLNAELVRALNNKDVQVDILPVLSR